ncbi:MAG TPA: metal ABC transporter ATP-binding protein [Tepidisphaeraceae bacterium]|jgi:zinc transport system ATP-binding protein
MPALIDIRDLDFAYGRDAALCGVTLPVEAGTTLGLIGPNGGGKTTLIKLLLGLLKPQRGTIEIDGLPPRKAVARGDLIGYLPQKPQLAANFPLDVRRLVTLGLAGKTGLLRSHAKEDLRFVDELIDRVGLTAIAHRPANDLSGGQLQRALIARALAPRPRVLVLDEPTTGVDSRGQRDFVNLITQLKADLGLTLLLVSHDLRAVTAVSDRVACLNLHLHYHDTPRHLPADVVYNLFGCDVAAMGVGAPQNAMNCCEHDSPGNEIRNVKRIVLTEPEEAQESIAALPR